MVEYYMSDGGRSGSLWKKEGYEKFFFSQKQLNWIKCKWIMILPCFRINTENEATCYIEDEKKHGPDLEEQLPIRYFLSDNDTVFAIDVSGNEYIVLKDKTLKSIPI